MALVVQTCPERGTHLSVLAVLLLVVSCASGTRGVRDDEPTFPLVGTDGSAVIRLGVASPELSARCLSAAKIGREVVAAEFGMPLFDEAHPLVVNIYPDSDALLRWAPDASAPSWRPPSAFTDGESNFALLARSEPWYLDLTGGAGAATLYPLWFEIARQGIERFTEARRVTWPGWFTDGLAECLAHECWRRDAGYPGREPLWWVNLTLTARRAAAAKELYPLWRLVHMEAYEANDEDAFRAEAASFCWFLRQDPAAWKRFVDRIDDLRAPGRTGMGTSSVDHFKAALVESYGDLVKLEERMLVSLSQAEEEWVPFLGFPERSGDGFLLPATPVDDACICRRVLPGPVFDLEFECRRLDDRPGVLLVFFAMDSPRPADFIRLGIADEGVLTIDRFRGGAYDRSETATYVLDRGTFHSDAWTRVILHVTDRHLEVVVGDLLLLDEKMPIIPGSRADYLGIGSESGVYEIRNIAHRSRPLPE